MQEIIINISFPIKEDILLSIKEMKDEFTNDIMYLSAFYFYRKRKLSLGKSAELVGYEKIEALHGFQTDSKETAVRSTLTDDRTDSLLSTITESYTTPLWLSEKANLRKIS